MSHRRFPRRPVEYWQSGRPVLPTGDRPSGTRRDGCFCLSYRGAGDWPETELQPG